MRPDELEAKLQLLHRILSEKWTPQRLDGHSWSFQHIVGWTPVSCYAEINPQMEAFPFRAIDPLPVDIELRALVAEFITRVNYALPIGNWAMDLDSGEVRWKSGIYFGSCDLSEPLIRHVIESSLFFIYQHLAGIAKIQVGGSLEEALATIGQDKGRGIIEGMKQPG